MIEEIETLHPEHDRRAFRRLDTALDEDPDVGGRRAAEGRLADDLAVDHGAIVVRAVAVVVDARRGVERTRRRELRHGAGRDVERQLVVERDHRAMTLIEQARSALRSRRGARCCSRSARCRCRRVRWCWSPWKACS